jgi:hypothetical protein
MSGSRGTDVIITGVPRSGTTLVCYLLNELPDTVALHEPIETAQWRDTHDHEVLCDRIKRFFASSRRSLLETGTAVSKQVDGRVPDNPRAGYPLLARLWPWRRLRQKRDSRGVITVEKSLSAEFLLGIKNTAFFTALLENLQSRYPCYAVVRNPLAVLASWNSIQFSLYDGHSPSAERVDRVLAADLSQISGRLGRQLHVLSWFFAAYRCLPPQDVIRYETLVASGGASLAAITPRAVALAVPLENKNRNEMYDHRSMRTLGETLLKTDGAFWDFYSRQSIEELLRDVSS